MYICRYKKTYMSNQTIRKFNASVDTKFLIDLPTGSEILSVQLDNNTWTLCMWVLLYPDNPTEERFFEIFVDDDIIPNDMGICRKYLNTYQSTDGQFIGHVFERIN